MVIREATHADIPRCVAMGRCFLLEVYAGLLDENPEHMAQIGADLIEKETGLLLVADVGDGHLVGMIGMVIVPHPLSGALVAAELFWWMEPAARGAGVRLLKRAERWARDRGIARVQMTAPTAGVGHLYERLGYQAIETAYQRSW